MNSQKLLAILLLLIIVYTMYCFYCKHKEGLSKTYKTVIIFLVLLGCLLIAMSNTSHRKKIEKYAYQTLNVHKNDGYTNKYVD